MQALTKRLKCGRTVVARDWGPGQVGSDFEYDNLTVIQLNLPCTLLVIWVLDLLCVS